MPMSDKELLTTIQRGLERSHRDVDAKPGLSDNELFVTLGGSSWLLRANRIPTHTQPATLPLTVPTPEPARPA